jgi:tetratricopeptide (TPR) repeat protein
LAQLYAASGDDSKAVAAYRMAIAMTGGDPPTWIGLAMTYKRMRRRKEAIHALAEAAAGTPKYMRRWRGTLRIRLKYRIRGWRDPGPMHDGRVRLWGGM